MPKLESGIKDPETKKFIKQDSVSYGGHLRPIGATYGLLVIEYVVEKSNIESSGDFGGSGSLCGTTYGS